MNEPWGNTMNVLKLRMMKSVYINPLKCLKFGDFLKGEKIQTPAKIDFYSYLINDFMVNIH